MSADRLFSFTINYVGWLKHIPLLPHVFEGILRMVTVIQRPAVARLINTLEHEVLKWEGVTVGFHRFGGIQFNAYSLEIGHIHGNGLLDLLLSRARKSSLLAEGRITHHPILRDSGWVSFRLVHHEDLSYALGLLAERYAYICEKRKLATFGQ